MNIFHHLYTMPWDIVFSNTLQKMKFLSTVRTPIVDRFPIEDPSLKIQIEDPFLFSKKWVLGVLY